MEKHENETIINFNQAEDVAYIFTYNKNWQGHLEQKLGLVPTEKNAKGGRSYILLKNQILLPRKATRIALNAQKVTTSIAGTKKKKLKT